MLAGLLVLVLFGTGCCEETGLAHHDLEGVIIFVAVVVTVVVTVQCVSKPPWLVDHSCVSSYRQYLSACGRRVPQVVKIALYDLCTPESMLPAICQWTAQSPNLQHASLQLT